MATFAIAVSHWAVEASAQVPTLTEAQAIAAAFPKSAKVYATTLGTYVKDEHGQPVPGPDGRRYQNITLGLVGFQAKLEADGVNGGRNETGIRRYHSFRRAAERLGHQVTYRPQPNPDGLTTSQLLQSATGWTD